MKKLAIMLIMFGLVGVCGAEESSLVSCKQQGCLVQGHLFVPELPEGTNLIHGMQIKPDGIKIKTDKEEQISSDEKKDYLIEYVIELTDNSIISFFTYELDIKIGLLENKNIKSVSIRSTE